jgi:MFS family permease
MRGTGGAALRFRDFRLFWVSMLATGLALQMAMVAIGWQVYSIHRNPLHLGLVSLAEFLPLPLLALPAGHIADRLPRGAVLASATIVDGMVAIGLLATTLAGARSLWPYLALAAATGCASALGAPSGRALTPALVPAEILPGALAVRSIAFQASAVGGPALGGILFSIRPELVCGTSAALSLLSFACVVAMRAAATRSAPSRRGWTRCWRACA